MQYSDVAYKSCSETQSKDILTRQLANCIRVLTMDAVEQAKSGHPGMPLGMADVATVLFSEFLHFIPGDAKWENRDRFILSAGHGSMLLYSLLYLTGYPDITLDDIKSFRQLNSRAAGHPEYGLLAGIETTTGPLGQGLANAVGIEVARNIKAAKLETPDGLDHKTYVIVGDGCLMEGISHEACSFAGHLGLKNLIMLYDSNDITIDGTRSLADSEDAALRFQAYGFHTQTIDGHDFDQIRGALANAQKNQVPSLIICRTKIAYGTPTKEGKSSSHGAPLGEDEVHRAKINYGWPEDKKFFVPEDLLKIWRGMYEKSLGKYNRHTNHPSESCSSHLSLRAKRGNLSSLSHEERKMGCRAALAMTASGAGEATRQSSGKALTELLKTFPLIGGSADLTGSNYTNPNGVASISRDNWNTNYISYGVREHAMGAIMNGIALYGGFIPYGGSFLVFMDYAKPALRMAALMELQVIYVMTHDSIGIGEDGPTHQSVEQLSYLRGVPNVNVFRPADKIETIECWELAIQARTSPSVICLTRQVVPAVRGGTTGENLCSLGAYILSESQGELKVTIFATGSEVSIALDAQRLLHDRNIGTRIVSVPCQELFDRQDEDYKKHLLDNQSIKVAIEAATRFGWDKYIGRDGIFIGMNGFGASAPYEALYKVFGITADSVLESVLLSLRAQRGNLSCVTQEKEGELPRAANNDGKGEGVRN